MIIAGLLTVLVTVFGGPATAWAHNSLVGTSPEDDTTVAEPPSTLVLTFNEPAIPTGTLVLVTGPDGSATEGDPRLVDTTVQQDLRDTLPAGEYTVEWRVTSADGHPINGDFTFDVRSGTVPDETPTASEPTRSDPAQGEPSPTDASSSPAATPNEVETDTGSFVAWPWVLGGIGVALAAVLGWRFSRR